MAADASVGGSAAAASAASSPAAASLDAPTTRLFPTHARMRLAGSLNATSRVRCTGLAHSCA